MIKMKSRTSEITILDNIVTKKFYSTLSPEDRHRLGPRNCVCGKPLPVLYKNEINILKKLKKYNHFPKLLSTDEKNLSYSMTYCGKNITYLKKVKKLKIPKNWEYQIKKINEALVRENLYNNDISHNNICILEDTIYLIDFGCCQSLDVKLHENYDNRDNLIDLKKKILEALKF